MTIDYTIQIFYTIALLTAIESCSTTNRINARRWTAFFWTDTLGSRKMRRKPGRPTQLKTQYEPLCNIC